MERTYTIQCTSRYYGYPQAEDIYHVKGEYNGEYFKCKLIYYGNWGWDTQVLHRTFNNGGFWEYEIFMQYLWAHKLNSIWSLREGQSARVVIDTIKETVTITTKE